MEIQVKSAVKRGYETATENDSIDLSFPESDTRRGRVGREMAQTLDCSCNQGVIEPIIYDDYNGRIKADQSADGTLTTKCGSTAERSGVKIIEQNYRIRKLTPRECWRLMGFDDEDFEKAKVAGISDSQLYKQAGNSIVVNVLEAIFEKMI